MIEWYRYNRYFERNIRKDMLLVVFGRKSNCVAEDSSLLHALGLTSFFP